MKSLKDERREFTKEESAARRRQRERTGYVRETAEAAAVQLAPMDSNRKRTRMCVTLDPLSRAHAKKIGKGNISRGIDKAIFAYVESKRVKK